MKENKILYAITVKDILNVSKENELPFTETDLPFIEEKIGDYLNSQWHDAIEFALNELQDKRKNNGIIKEA